MQFQVITLIFGHPQYRYRRNEMTSGQDIPGQSFSRRNVVIGVVGLIVVIVLVGWFTMSLDVTLPAKNDVVYPFTTTYDMKAPDGQNLMIGNTPFLALITGNTVNLKVGDSVSTLAVGDSKTITEKRAVVKMYGATVFDVNYRMDVTYRGAVNGSPDFYLIVKTTTPIPQFLIDRMLPSELEITAV